jgi:hypothetical protein
MDQGYIPIEGVTQMAYTVEGALKQNVFCLYALPCIEKGELVDQRNFTFGDMFIRFTRPDEFLRRVRTAAEKIGQEFCQGLVHYVPESYDGPVGPFRKRSMFSYQNEFRIVIRPGTGTPLTLDIGDIREITAYGPLIDLNHEIEKQWETQDRH